MLQSARNAFLQAVEKIPAWLSIRKRPEKSVSGRFLLSVLEERDNLKVVLDDFKKSFFLTHYIEEGIEEDVLSAVYIAPVNSSINSLITPKLEIISNVDIFLNNPSKYALLQDNYLILRDNTEDNLIYYTIDNVIYSARLEKSPVWNIFDEYALFLSLERYEGESNTDLAKRCLAVFKNPANSTATGLQNAIINDLMNDLPIRRDDIIIETPNADNLFLEDADCGTIYENITQLNQDIFRAKRFDFNLWEHNFRHLDWLPHKWDAKIDLYQDGVGQLNDLKISMSDNDSETTDVILHGYVKSQLLIDQYIHKNQFQRKMTLKLQKYLDTLKVTTIGYKIIAHETEKLDADHIRLESYSTEIAKKDYYLADLIDNPANLTILNQNIIATAGTYKLKFIPNRIHEPFNLAKITLTEPNGAVKNLIREDSRFKISGGVLNDSLALLHLTQLRQSTHYENLTDSVDGITLAKNHTSGKITVDVTGMSGASLAYEIETPSLLDITDNDNYTVYEGFNLNQNTLTASDLTLGSYVDIDVRCAEISFDFLAANSVAEQGSVTVNIKINGGTDLLNSGVWSASKTYHRKFNSLTRVQIHIQKSSTNPVSIANVKVARYDVKLSTAKGSIVKSLLSTSLPIFEGDNSLTVEIISYDSIAPILKYIHVGNDSINSSYEISNINISAGSKLDISSNRRTELHKFENNNEILVDANFSTKSKFRNNTSQDIMASINVDNFESITESSIPIHKTIYLGNTISYITIRSGETVDTISITGKLRSVRESYSLSELLNKSADEDVYISADVGAFIVKDRITLDERLADIKSSAFKTNASNYNFVNLPSTATGCFKSDGVTKSNSCATGFFNAWIELRQAIKYVAHNQSTLLTAEISNVPIIDSWTPTMNTLRLMFYAIETSAENSVMFEKTYRNETVCENWSLGKNSLGLKIINPSNNYNSEIFNIEEDFVISNSIPFTGERLIAGENQELASFIITPPDNMKINYSESSSSQTVNITNDGFSKLWYSNVGRIISVKVNNSEVNSSKYKLLNVEGIICWLDNDLFGETAQIIYQYKIPQSLSYQSIDALYDSVPYSIETYKILDETLTLKNLAEGDVADFAFQSEHPDKIISQCSNPGFLSVVNGNSVSVNLVSSDNSLTINTGYYLTASNIICLITFMRSR